MRESEIEHNECQFQARQRNQRNEGIKFALTLAAILAGLYASVTLIAPMM